MAMTPEVWDELIHLREDRQKMLEGRGLGTGKWWGFYTKNGDANKKSMRFHGFSGQLFSFPTFGYFALREFEDHNI